MIKNNGKIRQKLQLKNVTKTMEGKKSNKNGSTFVTGFKYAGMCDVSTVIVMTWS